MVEYARRVSATQKLTQERDMKTLAIIMSLAAFTAMGNSLPPTPETPMAALA